MRPEIEIVIPADRESAELDAVVAAIQRHTTGYALRVMVEPGLNVSECRQAAMDAAKSRYVCFMDADAHQLADGWLDELHRVAVAAPDAAVVYAGEWWGGEPPPAMHDPAPDAPWQVVRFGPAACMLVDRNRVPDDVKWCAPLGLANGWLGGDFEEVEYARRLARRGAKLYRATRTLFHHRGGRTTHKAFSETDRCAVIGVIKLLLKCQESGGDESPDWWAPLKRVRAAPDDDCTFAPKVVSPMRTIFRDLVLERGLRRMPAFQRLGIMD